LRCFILIVSDPRGKVNQQIGLAVYKEGGGRSSGGMSKGGRASGGHLQAEKRGRTALSAKRLPSDLPQKAAARAGGGVRPEEKDLYTR